MVDMYFENRVFLQFFEHRHFPVQLTRTYIRSRDKHKHLQYLFLFSRPAHGLLRVHYNDTFPFLFTSSVVYLNSLVHYSCVLRYSIRPPLPRSTNPLICPYYIFHITFPLLDYILISTSNLNNQQPTTMLSTHILVT